MVRPVLLLDVDGPLNPDAGKPHRRPEGYGTHRLMTPRRAAAERRRLARWGTPHKRPKPLRVWLNPEHGPALTALPYDLVWATTWMAEANALIGPTLGLPELPYIAWTELFGSDPDGLHWKTRDVVAWAAGRPFVWLDDELGPQDIEWIAANHPGEALPLWVDPRAGLHELHFAALREWAEEAPC